MLTHVNGRHISKELEIFEVTVEKTKHIKLLFNSLKSIPPTYILWERVEQDWTIAVLIIFVPQSPAREIFDFNNSCTVYKIL